MAARVFKANLLAPEQALALLCRWAGELRQPEADQIIAECGHLALAIAVIGPTLQEADHDAWSDTLDRLKNADISAIEESLTEGQASFFRSLEVSVTSLTPHIQQRYLALAVLLEDMPAALAVLQTLWGVSPSEGRQTSKHFLGQ